MLHRELRPDSSGLRTRDPLSGRGRWGEAGVVGGFEKAFPNPVLLDFVRADPLTEYNRPVPGRSLTRGVPVIYEGTYRRRRDTG